MATLVNVQVPDERQIREKVIDIEYNYEDLSRIDDDILTSGKCGAGTLYVTESSVTWFKYNGNKNEGVVLDYEKLNSISVKNEYIIELNNRSKGITHYFTLVKRNDDYIASVWDIIERLYQKVHGCGRSDDSE